MDVVHFDQFSRRDTLSAAFAKFPQVRFVRCVTQSELADALANAEVLVVGNRAYTPETAETVLKHGRALKWIQFTSSGLDNAHKFGLPAGAVVTNATGFRSGTVAEHAFTLLLGVARKLPALEQAKDREDWCRDAITPKMISVTGKHMLVIGLGGIGQEIARKAKAFDMTVTGISRTREPIKHVDRIRPRSELADACAEADVIVMSALYAPGEPPLLNKEAIGRMKRSAIVINIARGALIDEEALLDALNEGRIAGAGLDVQQTEPMPPGNPLWTCERALITPHVAGAGADEGGAMLHGFLADNMSRWLVGGPLKQVVVQPA